MSKSSIVMAAIVLTLGVQANLAGARDSQSNQQRDDATVVPENQGASNADRTYPDQVKKEREEKAQSSRTAKTGDAAADHSDSSSTTSTGGTGGDGSQQNPGSATQSKGR
jgi:hypothetical protein